jgi:hypothetical protein
MAPESALFSGNGVAYDKRHDTLDREKGNRQGQIVSESKRGKKRREYRFESVKQHRSSHADTQSRNCKMPKEKYGRSEQS